MSLAAVPTGTPLVNAPLHEISPYTLPYEVARRLAGWYFHDEKGFREGALESLRALQKQEHPLSQDVQELADLVLFGRGKAILNAYHRALLAEVKESHPSWTIGKAETGHYLFVAPSHVGRTCGEGQQFGVLGGFQPLHEVEAMMAGLCPAERRDRQSKLHLVS